MSGHHRTFILLLWFSHAGHTSLGHFTFYIFLLSLMCMIQLLQCMSQADLGGPIDPSKNLNKFNFNFAEYVQYSYITPTFI